MRIARLFQFDAAHRLDHHDGKCRCIHGHTYRLELVLTGPVHPPVPADPQSGFVTDFGRLDHLVQRELLDPYLDHKLLNDSVPGLPYPSAEYLAAWIAAWCIARLDHHPELGTVQFERLRLWESTNAWAEADRLDAAPMAEHIPLP